MVYFAVARQEALTAFSGLAEILDALVVPDLVGSAAVVDAVDVADDVEWVEEWYDGESAEIEGELWEED